MNLTAFTEPILVAIERRIRPPQREALFAEMHARSATPEGFLSAVAEQLLDGVPEHRRAEAIGVLTERANERLEALRAVVDAPRSAGEQHLAALCAGEDIVFAAYDLRSAASWLPVDVPLREELERTAARRAAAMPGPRGLPAPGSARHDTTAALRAAMPPEADRPAEPGSSERDGRGSDDSGIPGRAPQRKAPSGRDFG